jgi:pimeloyl-ACP methyl ester carboxylesterase
MRKSIFLLGAFVFTFSFFGQAQINYGSNNGNYLTIRGTKLYYEEYGKGTPLLMLHGGFGNISDFQKCIPELSKKFRLIVPDAPGQGHSDFPDSSLSYHLKASYYSLMIDQLKLDSVYVLGWSDGGNEGLLLANYRPDKVKKLLVSGANYKSSGIIGIEGADSTILNLDWLQRNWKNTIDAYTKLSPDHDWKRYFREMGKVWTADEYFPKSILESLNIPVLVVYGDHDAITLSHGIEIKNAIKNSQFCILPNTSHFVFDEQPDLIGKIAMIFFR